MKKMINKKKLFFYREEGELIPKFYLPVRYHHYNFKLECWIFFLAPFVWFLYVIYNIFCSIIKDCLEWERLLEQKYKGFKNIED